MAIFREFILGTLDSAVPISLNASICLFVLVMWWTTYLCFPASHQARGGIENCAGESGEDKIMMMFCPTRKHPRKHAASLLHMKYASCL